MRQKMPELSQYKPSTITKAALAKYPALATWGKPLGTVTYGWADLMWFESNVMHFTMLALKREHQIPSLSVHDSLILPAHGAQTAQAVVREKFRDQRRVTPLLKVNWSKTLTSQPEEPKDTKEESRVG
jgi:hypothetical protein